MLAQLASDENPLPDLEEGHLLAVCSHGLSSVRDVKRESTSPIMGAPPPRPHLNLITSQGPLLTPSHGELGLQHVTVGETHTFSPQQCLAEPLTRCGGGLSATSLLLLLLSYRLRLRKVKRISRAGARSPFSPVRSVQQLPSCECLSTGRLEIQKDSPHGCPGLSCGS